MEKLNIGYTTLPEGDLSDTILDRNYHPDKADDGTKRETLNINDNFSASGTYRTEREYGSERTTGHLVGLTIN